MSLPASITKSPTPTGGYVFSTPFGPISATANTGVGWTLSQWAPATGTDWLGQFGTLFEVEAHLAANYAR